MILKRYTIMLVGSALVVLAGIGLLYEQRDHPSASQPLNHPIAHPAPAKTPSRQEFADIDQAVAIEAGFHGIPAGTQTSLQNLQYFGDRAQGHVTFSNGAPAQDFTVIKRAGHWTAHY